MTVGASLAGALSNADTLPKNRNADQCRAMDENRATEQNRATDENRAGASPAPTVGASLAGALLCAMYGVNI